MAGVVLTDTPIYEMLYHTIDMLPFARKPYLTRFLDTD